MFLSKSLNNVYDFEILRDDRITIKRRREGLRVGSTILEAPRGHSNSYLSSYFPRVVTLLNSFPQEMRDEILVY